MCFWPYSRRIVRLFAEIDDFTPQSPQFLVILCFFALVPCREQNFRSSKREMKWLYDFCWSQISDTCATFGYPWDSVWQTRCSEALAVKTSFVFGFCGILCLCFGEPAKESSFVLKKTIWNGETRVAPTFCSCLYFPSSYCLNGSMRSTENLDVLFSPLWSNGKVTGDDGIL